MEQPECCAVHMEARLSDGTRYVLLRLGPYIRCSDIDRDIDRLVGGAHGIAPRIRYYERERRTNPGATAATA
ncbi:MULTISPECIES: hypothetical protein [unclassified Streptomyces]|uniref:hypothetical protein n=1 Tax=unclassified Streptomyces TaxID=2593676 RepID=UPI0029A2FEB7|nr:hypothetical protein [Streptomyces sp. DK15]MDX2391095.1 hypothetical protein [Streptomyces sp. DK15]